MGGGTSVTRMKNTNYVQCALQNGDRHHMAWIPQIKAIINKVLKIKKDDDSWEDGWKVVGISDGVVKSAAEANEASQAHKKGLNSIRR